MKRKKKKIKLFRKFKFFFQIDKKYIFNYS